MVALKSFEKTSFVTEQPIDIVYTKYRHNRENTTLSILAFLIVRKLIVARNQTNIKGRSDFHHQD